MRTRLFRCSVILTVTLALASPALAQREKAKPFPAALDVSSLKDFQVERAHQVWDVLEDARLQKNFLAKKKRLEPQIARLRRLGTKSPAPLYLLGLVHVQLEDHTRAARALGQATELQPDFFGAHRHLANSKLELGKVQRGKKRRTLLDEALAEIDAALKIKAKSKAASKLNAENFEAYFLRVQILLALALAAPDPNKSTGAMYNDASKEWIRTPEYRRALKYLVSVIKKTPARSPLRRSMVQLQLHVRQAYYGAPKEWKESGEFFVRRKKHYRIITNHSQGLADELAEQANFIYRAYKAKVFKDIPEPEQIFNVFVYTEPKEYVKLGGGSRNSLGFYSPFTRILVVYYTEDDPEQSILVLNHEAMHQFVHDNLNNAPMWFNEGLGDYFGPYKRVGKTGVVSAPNPLRLDDGPNGGLGIKSMIAKGLAADFKELMLKTHAEFYDRRVIGPKTAAVSRNYAQAWSIMYFLHETEKGKTYMRHLQKYYSLLRKGRHFHEAFEKSFGKIDLETFRHDWEVAVLGF